MKLIDPFFSLYLVVILWFASIGTLEVGERIGVYPVIDREYAESFTFIGFVGFSLFIGYLVGKDDDNLG